MVAVDVGMDSDAADFLHGLTQLDISPDRLTAVLLTHWHNDHSAGASFLQRRFGVPLYYAGPEEPFLTRKTSSGGVRAWLGKHVPEEGVLVLLRGLLEEAAPVAVAPDRRVHHGDVVERAFRVLGTPGHTPGHVAFLYQPSRILFCGDALAVVGNERIRSAMPARRD